MLTGSEIRRKFLEFFKEKNHKVVPSSSLVPPADDPTLLFTNAGMNQFKDVFLGLEKRDYARATTSQKCVRAGGKHNDLENVGFTNRHHTFFEMLGNFSFGDYFKKDAIAYAWELITSPEWFGIPKDKLYATIFKGEGGVPRDSEAYDLWFGQGVPKERIFEFGTKDNFWQMGDTGPCGPCSEIHYDMGVYASDQGHGTSAPACEFGCDCGRYVELWNLVFMQFDRDASGKLTPLPKPSIDTGAGLERIAAVLQGKISNYETDLFTPLTEEAERLTGLTGVSALAERAQEFHSKSAASLRVIADHSRAATFLISDGVVPSNEGRGYVLRKVIRRAIRHGRLLGQTKPFLHKMVSSVCDLMQNAYPELEETAGRVEKVIFAEETRFAHTMEVGSEQLDKLIDETRAKFFKKKLLSFSPGIDPSLAKQYAQMRASELAFGRLTPSSEHGRLGRAVFGGGENERKFDLGLESERVALPGDQVFRLYDTFGLPLDFVEDVAHDQLVTVDRIGFERAMTEQRERAKASWRGAAKGTANPIYRSIADGTFFISRDQRVLLRGLETARVEHSVFEGYRQTRSDNCEVLAIIKGGRVATDLKPGESGEIILDRTPFYAESGGQVGDRGWLYSDDHNTVIAEVTGCYYPIEGVRAHQVVAKQAIRVGDKVDAVVNADIRSATMRNHTATHLLHAGLREVLGKHVKQAGSLVAPNHLRFDFSHFTGVEDEELQDIEDIINKEVLRNERVEIIENVPIRRRRQRVSRHGPVRREVRRQSPRDQDRRFLHRTLRRHPHACDRRDRPDQDSERRQRVVGRAADRGRHRRKLAASLP